MALIIRLVAALFVVTVSDATVRKVAFTPRSQQYYYITHANGMRLAVDQQKYREHAGNASKGTRPRKVYSDAIITAPTNGDFEKWRFIERSPGIWSIANKATGLYLTCLRLRSRPIFHVFVQERSMVNKTISADEQNFIIVPTRNKLYFNIAPATLDKIRIAATVGSSKLQGLVFGTAQGNEDADWSVEPVACNPFPSATYVLANLVSGKPLYFPHTPREDSDAGAAYSEDVRPYLFKFLPTGDPKVFYISHYDSGKVIDVKGRGNEYGAQLILADKEEGQLYQQFYLLPAPDGQSCIIGSVANYRYIGLGHEENFRLSSVVPLMNLLFPLLGSDDFSYQTFIQKEQSATLDEFFILKDLEYDDWTPSKSKGLEEDSEFLNWWPNSYGGYGG